MSMNLIALLYLVASVFFIQALKGLSHPTTSIRGNVFGMTGMTIAVLTTIGIVMSVLFESLHFFHMVPLANFFFGTVWDPRFAAAGAGALASPALVRAQARTAVNIISTQGVAILMATHDLFRAKETGTRIGIMREGRLMQELSTTEVSHADVERIRTVFPDGHA